jgi:hypothetical protein
MDGLVKTPKGDIRVFGRVAWSCSHWYDGGTMMRASDLSRWQTKWKVFAIRCADDGLDG